MVDLSVSTFTPAPANGLGNPQFPPPPPPPPPRTTPSDKDTFERVTGPAPLAPPQNLQTDMEKNVVDVTKKIDGKVGFAPSQAQVRFNDQFWEKTPNGIKPKDGVKPSDAVADFTAHPEKYSLDCAMDSKMIHDAALNQTLGPAKFNEQVAKHGGLDISFGEYTGINKDLAKTLRENPKDDLTKRPPVSMPGDSGSWIAKNERPGDAVYFDNPGVTPAGRAAGFRGENAIYLGKNDKGEKIFYAHGMGENGSNVLTEQQIADKLMKQADPASFVVRMDEISRPTPGAL
jgi:hypothetical protein